MEQLDDPEEGWLHVPYNPPFGLVQIPPQQSVFEAQVSPFC
jgi:hypothetical protein